MANVSMAWIMAAKKGRKHKQAHRETEKGVIFFAKVFFLRWQYLLCVFRNRKRDKRRAVSEPIKGSEKQHDKGVLNSSHEVLSGCYETVIDSATEYI